MAEKLCIFCKHIDHEDGGYGEYAEADRFVCGKGKWDKISDPAHQQIYDWWRPWRPGAGQVDCDELAVFRIVIKAAETCDSYDPVG